MKHFCHDYGDRADCLGEADERYTMRFDDIDAPPIHWCARCGPEAQAMHQAILKACTDPDFAEKFARSIDEAAASLKARAN